MGAGWQDGIVGVTRCVDELWGSAVEPECGGVGFCSEQYSLNSSLALSAIMKHFCSIFVVPASWGKPFEEQNRSINSCALLVPSKFPEPSRDRMWNALESTGGGVCRGDDAIGHDDGNSFDFCFAGWVYKSLDMALWSCNIGAQWNVNWSIDISSEIKRKWALIEYVWPKMKSEMVYLEIREIVGGDKNSCFLGFRVCARDFWVRKYNRRVSWRMM